MSPSTDLFHEVTVPALVSLWLTFTSGSVESVDVKRKNSEADWNTLVLTSFSEELADNRTSCASKNSDKDSVIDALLSLDTWCTRAGDSSTESCF